MTSSTNQNARLPTYGPPLASLIPAGHVVLAPVSRFPDLQLIAGDSVMSQPEPSPLITKFLATLYPIDVVLTHRNHDDEHIVLLREADLYAVCRLHPARRIATTPNYYVESGEGQLRSPLSKSGLLNLLHWTDLADARDRYSRLTRETESPGDTHCPPSLRLVDARRESE